MVTRTQLQQRLATLTEERSTWWSTFTQITAYLLPWNGRYYRNDRNRGQRRGQNILDTTATHALGVLSAGMMSGLTSPARPWFILKTEDADLNKSYQAKLWLAQVSRKILDLFNQSNTYRALHMIYEELGAFGTSASLILPDFKRTIWHYPITAGRYMIAANWRGEVDTVYREFEVTVSNLVREFGKDKVSQSVLSLFSRGNLDSWVPVVHVIEPRSDRSGYGSLGFPWRSTYFEAGSDTPLREGGFETFPGLVPRWATPGGDVYGHGPGWTALGAIKQLQQESLRKGQAIDYATDPPLAVPSTLKNRDLNRLPGGITYYDGVQSVSPIKSLFDVQLDLNAVIGDIQDIRERINRSFFVDVFLMIQQRTNDRMTVPEISALQEEKMLMLGPVLERLHTELLIPLVDMAFSELVQRNQLPAPPMELQGHELSIEVISILAQAQKAVATNTIDRYTTALGSIAGLRPEVLDNFNVDEWAKIYADRLGVDERLLVPGAQVALIRKQKAQDQARAQQVTQDEQAASTAQKLGSIPEHGSVLNNLQGYR